MTLATEDIEYIRKNLGSWMAEQSLTQPTVMHEFELRERMVRVEEELRHQRDLMIQGFAQSDKRFEEMQNFMDKRFEQMDKRFEQVDKRFEELSGRIDRFMIWSSGFTLSVGGFIIAILKIWS